MVAFIPTCRRERESARSHVLVLEGTSAVGVVVDSIGGGTVDVMTAVKVGDGVAAVVGDRAGSRICVAVGEKTGIVVDVICAGAMVPVTVGVWDGVSIEGRRVAVAVGNCEFPLQSRNRKRSSSRIATISLKRS